MKFLVALLLTAILSFAVGLYLPWWTVAPVAFLVALAIHQRWWKALLSSFLGVFLLWALLAWMIDTENEGLLSSRVAELFSLGSSLLLVAVSAFIGALVAGLAAVSGSLLRGASH